MKKIAILYFSGAGSTRKVASLIYKTIHKKCDATLRQIEQAGSLNLNEYDALIIGTPVYHAAPAELIMAYFSTVAPLPKLIPTFIYNARTLCSGNTNRILAKHLKRCNIVTVLDRKYRTPASDASLLLPSVKAFFKFDKKLKNRVASDSLRFLTKIDGPISGYIPRFRFSSIINAPNKLLGQSTTFTIYTHKQHCIKCKKCAVNCPHNAIIMDESGYPSILRSKCENCYRCIHHCPSKALSLNKHHGPEKLLKID